MPRTKRALEMDMLARMAESWTENTSAMLTVTIAMVLLKLDRTTVMVPLDNVGEIMDKYDIDRTYIDVEGVPHMVVTLREKQNAETISVNAEVPGVGTGS